MGTHLELDRGYFSKGRSVGVKVDRYYRKFLLEYQNWG
jgi:hypothetical protein